MQGIWMTTWESLMGALEAMLIIGTATLLVAIGYSFFGRA
jgi:hypothetical protein